MLKEIKEEIKNAMIAKNTTKRDVLRLVVGQVQQSGDESDEAVLKVVKKLIKSNTETLDALAEKNLQESSVGTPTVSNEYSKIIEENSILSAYVPASMSKEDIEKFIAKNNIDVRSAKNDGQAMGMLMKPLKATGKEVDSKVVKEVIAEIRS